MVPLRPSRRSAALLRALLASAVLVSGIGAAVALTRSPGRPLAVSTSGGLLPTTTGASGFAPGEMPSTTAATATTSPAAGATSTTTGRRTTTTGARSTSSTAAPARPTGPTTTTTFDWKAHGYPGPVGSTIQPWDEAPYRRSDTGIRSSLTASAAANGAVPGGTMALTITATWSPLLASGSVVLVGPMDYTKPLDQQRTQVLTSFTDSCPGDPLHDRGTERTVTVQLPMRQFTTATYTTDPIYAISTTDWPCNAAEGGGQDADVTMSFHVAQPYVVAAPGPPLGHTG